jgi:hypothetical protein
MIIGHEREAFVKAVERFIDRTENITSMLGD